MNLSLGNRMLEMGGFVDTVDPADRQARMAEWSILHTSHRQSELGQLTSEGQKDLKAQITTLRSKTLAKADVIVTTCSNAGVAAVYMNFKPDVIYIDEAGKAMDLDVGIVMARYRARAIVLVGDDKQLRPTVVSHEDDNSLRPHLTKSLFERLKQAGRDSILFREQHRMATTIADLRSEMCYGNRLSDAESTRFKHRDKAVRFQQFLQANYPSVNNTTVKRFLDVASTSTGKTGRSTHNLATQAVGMNVVQELIQNGISAADIAIVTQHDNQYDNYRSSLQIKSTQYSLR